MLCLVCSSSLPPIRSHSSGSDILFTNCCKRPICPSCIASKPRLARYDPCLACLVGVDVLASASDSTLRTHTNLNGSFHGEGAFILGDDDEDEDGGAGGSSPIKAQPPNLDIATSSPIKHVKEATILQIDNNHQGSSPEMPPIVPFKYYLKRSDTLQGLSLRFGIDVINH